MSTMMEGAINNLDMDESAMHMNDSSFMKSKMSHGEGVTYFGPDVKLNDSAMMEYGLKKFMDGRKSTGG